MPVFSSMLTFQPSSFSAGTLKLGAARGNGRTTWRKILAAALVVGKSYRSLTHF